MKKIVLFLTLFAFGCASTHPGAHGTKIEGNLDGLDISVNPVQEYSDKTNIFLDFVLENKGSRWIKIDQVQLDFPNSEKVIHNVIVGDDLKVWAESYANKKRRDDHNADIGVAGVVLAGLTVAVMGVSSKNSGLLGAGLATAGGAGAWSDFRKVKEAQLGAQGAVAVPENYILAPMTIPSQGFLRRWALVNIPQELVAKKVVVSLKLIDGETIKYEVPIQMD